MFSRTRIVLSASALIANWAAACGDGSPGTPAGTVPEPVRASASVQWNDRAVSLTVARPPTANGQAAVSRTFTYLSLAQYRAVMAVQATGRGSRPASVSAAVGGASVAVLNGLFPLDVASNEGLLQGDLAAHSSPGESPEEIAEAESMGRGIGAAVLTQAGQDNYLVLGTDGPPVGPGMWTSSMAAIVRSLHGARPFFLTSAHQLRAPPPPEFGSPAFVTALTEVRQISDSRTPDQLRIAQFWNVTSGPFTVGSLNVIAVGLIRENGSTEQESTRILAFANAAMFDAAIACWDTKFTYWVLRPSQADPMVTMPIGLPNHPSYPSGHSCLTASMMAVLSDAFPKERARLEAMVEEAGLSRVYGGIHYRFDIDAGRTMGRAAADLALKGSLTL